ncbi:MAG: alpha/beta fold hydrolase [Gemmatimonadota bacterium]
MAGLLDLPNVSGRVPVMVFVPGSGTSTKEADREAVDIAVPQGIAVFRYDKRGLGQSTGTFVEVTTANSAQVLADRASDVSAIVNYLATHARVNPSRIFLWGTSQGAWVAPLVAAQNNRVAFIINVSGGGSPVGTVIEYERQGRDASLSIAEITSRAAAYTGPFGYDPIETLRSLTIPVLWIYGGQDRNTPSTLDIARLQQLNKQNFTTRLYPRMNHDMRDVDTNTYPAMLFPEMLAWATPFIR